MLIGVAASLWSPLVHAVAWTVEDESVTDANVASAAFGPDGRLYVIHLDDTVPSSPTGRVARLVIYDRGSFSGQTLEVVGPSGGTTIEHFVEMVADRHSVWAVWRKKESTGPGIIRAAKVYPLTGPPVIETVDSGSSFNRFDACMGAGGTPRVAFINSNYRGVTVVRRTFAGTWESNNLSGLQIPTHSIYREIQIAAGGSSLDLFLCATENLSLSGGGTGHQATLTHRSAVEPGTWSLLNFGSATPIEDVNFPTDDTAAIYLDAEWTPAGQLAIAYSQVDERDGKLAILESGGWVARTYQDVSVGITRGVSMAGAADGSIHVSWTNTLNTIQHQVWDGSSFSVADPVGTVRSFYPRLACDSRGVPYFASTETDGSLLQVSTPTDFTDEDQDGIIYLFEDAFHSDPLVPNRDSLPIFSIENVGGMEYLALSFLGDSGGSGNNPYVATDFTYSVELSHDGTSWSTTGTVLKDRFTIPGRGTVSTIRSQYPIGDFTKELLRVKVERN
ncbi:hypothetical protein HAHE_07560 [Haloferula helveola]|uniref:F5/8 type C domain-containing protein n=2 Tax=Haloferula helveola TaxID=490095 RepID=A0ABM7RIK4_9BACT|nr:hypothetical protein HAHE_07560 [Haloferula helveola]